MEAAPAPEDPGVAEAMARGEKLFPDLMKASGPAIRKALLSVVPVTFETIADFGADPLARIAALVGEVSTASEDLRRIDAAKEVRDIVSEASRGKAKTLLLDAIGAGEPFDPVSADTRIDGTRGALVTERYKIRKMSVDLDRAMLPLDVAIGVLRILSEMATRDDLKTIIRRRADLFSASATEVAMAKKQLENLQKLAEEGIAQCDELKTVTLPALGFRRGL